MDTVPYKSYSFLGAERIVSAHKPVMARSSTEPGVEGERGLVGSAVPA